MFINDNRSMRSEETSSHITTLHGDGEGSSLDSLHSKPPKEEAREGEEGESGEGVEGQDVVVILQDTNDRNTAFSSFLTVSGANYPRSKANNHNDNNNVNSGDDGGFPRHPTSSLSLGQRWVSDIMGSLRFYSLIVGLSVAVYWIFISLVPVINKHLFQKSLFPYPVATAGIQLGAVATTLVIINIVQHLVKCCRESWVGGTNHRTEITNPIPRTCDLKEPLLDDKGEWRMGYRMATTRTTDTAATATAMTSATCTSRVGSPLDFLEEAERRTQITNRDTGERKENGKDDHDKDNDRDHPDEDDNDENEDKDESGEHEHIEGDEGNEGEEEDYGDEGSFRNPSAYSWIGDRHLWWKIRHIAPVGLLFGLKYGVTNLGLFLVPTPTHLLLQSTDLVWTALASWFINNERVSFLGALCLVGCTIGSILLSINLGQSLAAPIPAIVVNLLSPVLLGLCLSTLRHACTVLMNPRNRVGGSVSALEITAIKLVLSSAVAFLLACIMEGSGMQKHASPSPSPPSPPSSSSSAHLAMTSASLSWWDAFWSLPPASRWGVVGGAMPILIYQVNCTFLTFLTSAVAVGVVGEVKVIPQWLLATLWGWMSGDAGASGALARKSVLNLVGAVLTLSSAGVFAWQRWRHRLQRGTRSVD